MKTRMIVFLMFLSLFYVLNFSMAAEPPYPTKPIEIMVGFSPGAFTDLATRLIAENSKQYLGQEVVVINKPGASGGVAMTLISKAKPDGYTLGAVTDSTIILLPFQEKVSYKPLEDFTFICQTGTIDFGIVVLTDSPFRSLKDVIGFAKANPDKLTVGSMPGATQHVALEALSSLEGIKIKLVPFSGAAPTITSLLGGHVMVASTGFSGFAAHLKAGTVRLLAVMSDERLDEYPEVPTLKELGYPLVFQSFHIIVGPKNMDKSIVKKLSDVFSKTIESADFIKFAKKMETWAKKPLSGDELKEAIIQRSKGNEGLFKRLGMGIK